MQNKSCKSLSAQFLAIHLKVIPRAGEGKVDWIGGRNLLMNGIRMQKLMPIKSPFAVEWNHPILLKIPILEVEEALHSLWRIWLS
jgi:hypothetical protein